jgi:DNA-binding transcriptional LysR family regulator
LGIPKSAIGKAVALMDEGLGVEPFHRTTRRPSLTADGEAFYAVRTPALDDIGELESNLGTRQANAACHLWADMPTAFNRRVVLPVLLDIAKRYPALQLTLTFADRVIDLVEEGVDLAICFGPIETAPTWWRAG